VRIGDRHWLSALILLNDLTFLLRDEQLLLHNWASMLVKYGAVGVPVVERSSVRG
jgi:hypothetical protein